MKKLLLMVFALVAVTTVTTGCGPSAEEKAAQRAKDSLDSIRRADSTFEAQTREMMLLDTLIEHNAASKHKAI